MKFSLVSKKDKGETKEVSDFIKSYKARLQGEPDEETAKDKPPKSKKQKKKEAEIDKVSPRDAILKSFDKFNRFQKTVNTRIHNSSTSIKKNLSDNQQVTKFRDSIKITRKFSLLDYFLITLFSIGLIISLAYLIGPKILPSTFKKVAVAGGNINELMIGSPQNINPLSVYPVAENPSLVDDSLASLIYSSPLKLNAHGKLEHDAIENLEIAEDNKKYTLHIRKDIKFHDNEQLTAEDVVYTINLIKDPSYNKSRSSLLDWKDIEVDLKDEYTLELTQKESSNILKELLTFGILPEHIWKDSDPMNFYTYTYNLKPRGSGAFMIKDLEKNNLDEITGLILEKNQNYYGTQPKIDTIKFLFFKDKDELASNIGNIKDANYGYFQDTEAATQIPGNSHTYQTTRFFTLFVNMKQDSVWSKNYNMRRALAIAVNKEAIINEVFHSNATAVNSPIPPNSPFVNNNLNYSEFSLKSAVDILDKEGWKKEDKNGDFLSKDGQTLSLTITVRNSPTLETIANLLSKQYAAAGIKADVNVLDKEVWDNEIFDKKEYQTVLHGTSIRSSFIDLYSFWHSKQINGQGYNFSRYKDEEIDKHLEIIRSTNDESAKQSAILKFQELLFQKQPSVDILSQSYTYITSDIIKGSVIHDDQLIIKPRDRFATIQEWRLKERIVVD